MLNNVISDVTLRLQGRRDLPSPLDLDPLELAVEDRVPLNGSEEIRLHPPRCLNWAPSHSVHIECQAADFIVYKDTMILQAYVDVDCTTFTVDVLDVTQSPPSSSSRFKVPWNLSLVPYSLQLTEASAGVFTCVCMCVQRKNKENQRKNEENGIFFASE